MQLYISKILENKYMKERVKFLLAVWLFIFLVIITFCDMKSEYFGFEIDQLNTKINQITINNIKEQIESLKGKDISIKPIEEDIKNLENQKTILSMHSQRLAMAKYLTTLYVCIMTLMTFCNIDFSFVYSIGIPGLLVIAFYLISALI